MQTVATHPPVALSDLAFETCVERPPLGEAWHVHVPDGRLHLCQFLPPGEPEADARLNKLKAWRHRGLVPFEVARGDGGRLALLTPLDGPTLRDRYQECRQFKLPGIPRDELLEHLRWAITTLELMFSRYQLQHLWLQPRHILLKDNRTHLIGFGVVETWWGPTHQPTADLNPRYSAPELAQRVRGPHCDQYSLALIYAEMLTGIHPLRSRSGSARTPDLGLLPEHDRNVIAQALRQDSRRRFESAGAMLHLLENPPKRFLPPPPPRSLIVQPVEPTLVQRASVTPCQSLEAFVRELAHIAAGKVHMADELNVRFTVEPERPLGHGPSGDRLNHQAHSFDSFCAQWHAKTTHRADGLVILAINAEPTLWQWLSRKKVGLEIRLQFNDTDGPQRSDVAVTIRPFGCDRTRAMRFVEELGPKLLDSVREHLGAQPEQRGRERIFLRERLRVRPIIQGLPDEPIECYTKDVSTGGIGFFLPKELAASEVYVSLPEMEQIAAYAGLAQVVRKHPVGDGWYEIGAAFRL